MKTLDSLPYFGKIRLNYFGQDDYFGEIQLNGRRIQIELHFEESKNLQTMILLNSTLHGINELSTKLYNELITDFKSNGIVSDFIDWFLQVATDSELNLILGSMIDKTIDQLFVHLKLHRISIYYPEIKEGFIVFDYYITNKNNKRQGDQLIAIRSNLRNNLTKISWES